MKNRLPIWFRQKLPSPEAISFSNTLQKKFGLNTVCQSARCPNISHCFSNKHATFLILGNHCTRNCRFCAVEQSSVFEQKEPYAFFVDKNEPQRIARACNYFNLEYVVITSVNRDDLPDGGVGQFVDTINEVRKFNPLAKIEILIPDFMGQIDALEKVVRAHPQVISHNLETVKRIFPLVRNKASYRSSLEVLRNIKYVNPNQITKSSIMLGLGELDKDLEESLRDLREVQCDMLVLGQYLRPSLNQCSVEKFYTPEEFKYWEDFAYGLGFKRVCALPLARTSYRAKEQQLCMM